jgi:HlyD family secretion protein
MLHSSRSVSAGFAALALGLIAYAPQAAEGQQPPKRVTPASQLAAELDRLRALEPADRLRLVEKLAGANTPFAAARRGDLVASVVERGTIEPANFADLICNVKAREKGSAATTIKWLIDDGSMVKMGDLLARLDDSAVRDQLDVATVKVKEASAALAQASENAPLVRRENEIEVRLAEIDVKLAEIELKDPPPGKAKQVLELKVEQAKLKLERAVSRAKVQLVQAEAEVRARTAARESEVERLRSLQAELKLCELIAPTDGLLVYHVPPSSRFGGAAVVAQGEPVREGQKLLRVVELKQFVVATRVHESQVSTVRTGQATQVRVDAFPDKQLRGKVTRVSPVASAPDWLAADIKVYPVTISIEDAPPGLKPEMSCEVHIATGERKAVLQVPRNAVVSAGKDRVCFIKSGQELHERKVVTGAGNATSVEVTEGLKEGDLVVADPPALLVRP